MLLANVFFLYLIFLRYLSTDKVTEFIYLPVLYTMCISLTETPVLWILLKKAQLFNCLI